jgi:hypothetical protein
VEYATSLRPALRLGPAFKPTIASIKLRPIELKLQVHDMKLHPADLKHRIGDLKSQISYPSMESPISSLKLAT